MLIQFSLILFVILYKLPMAVLISSSQNKTAHLLLELANYALESRQNYHPYRPNQLPAPNYYGLLKYPPESFDYYHQQQQEGVRPPQRPLYHPRPGFGSQNFNNHRPQPSNQETIMDVLFSIAQNDKLRCVPRLLCELTSDTLSSQSRQIFGFLPSLIPVNFDMNSAIGLLSVFDGENASPITTFAKAAVLGYISKGNANSCFGAYPQCPREADKLVQYLNNYNGGFFRFFNGINSQTPSNNYAPNYGNYHPNNYPNYQQRIQNKPVQYVPITGNRNPENFGLPNRYGDHFSIGLNRPGKSLTFPDDDASEYNEFTFRKPKELPFSINHYYSNELDLQKPLPNHKATPMIFPDRTGTGDLRLDPEELNENYKQHQYNLQNNNFISFNPFPTNEGFYYRVPEGVTNNNPNNKDIFSFPV